MTASNLTDADVRSHQRDGISKATLNPEQITELDGIADVLHFLHNSQPLPGSDYSEDQAFKAGQTEILEWLERRARAIGADGIGEVTNGE